MQENHWESPYLDTSAVGSDLEEIAARMRRLIPRIIDDNLDPEFSFFDFAEETVEEVGSGLPEWMDKWDEGYLFGLEVTGCLLEWARCTSCQESSKREGKTAFEFIDSVREFEASNDEMALNGNAIVDFVLDLDDSRQKEILTGIEETRRSPHWESVLDLVHSGWFLLHTELLKRWTPSRHAEICRKNIQQDWKLALPVLEGLLEKKVFDEATAIAEEAIQGVLSFHDGEAWDPAKELLICHPRPYLFMGSEREIVRLFELWSKIVSGLGKNELSSALSLQALMFDKWEHWDSVLSEFDKTSKAGFIALANRFFSQWKFFVTEKTERFIPGDNWSLEWSWVPLLVDAARARRRNHQAFHQSMRRWLHKAGQSADNIKRTSSCLEQLTLDMDDSSAVRKASPALHRMLYSECEGNPLLGISRKKWLKRLGASAFFPDIME